MTEPDAPRIYVASLADYNAGRLWGRWIEANQPVESITPQVEEMLALSPEPDAEEWAIHDYEGFGPLQLGEWENLGQVAIIGRGITEHGVAFAHWANHLGRNDWNDLVTFEDCFRGQYDSVENWALEQLDAFGIDPEAHDDRLFGQYWRFNLEAFAQDLASDFAVYEDATGVYVFEP